MKVILVILGIVATARAKNSCDDSFNSFFKSLASEISSDAKNLETENRDDYSKLCSQCFASDSSDGGKCYLTHDELTADPYGEEGPMRGCSRCQGLARGVRDKILHSKPEVRACFRSELSAAIVDELEPCVQGKISDGYDFRVSRPLPDFDKETFNYIDIVEAALNERIMANSRLDACRNVNPGKFQSTNPCMQSGYSGIYARHCKAAKSAKSNGVSSSCSSRFGEVKKATCACMLEKREDWHNRFNKVQDIVSSSQTASECGNRISDVLGAWLSKLQNAMNKCLPSANGQQRQQNLHTLIELGCGQVINGGVKKNELTIGFRFVRLLLDGLNERLLIFCDKNCSY